MKKISVLFLLSFITFSAFSCQPAINDPTDNLNNGSLSPTPSPDGEISLSTPVPSQVDPVTVSTFAGSKTGFADGTGTNAQFDNPFGLGIDKSNNLYVADSFNERIRKITPAGVVTTFAGSTQGFKDGSGTGAQFSTITGLAMDNSGNIAVTDTGNHCIRKITPAGVVSTIAGGFSPFNSGGESGYSDGSGTNAKFNSPQGLAYDKSGNLYVADRLNHVIRLISPAGNVTTFAGTAKSSGYADGSSGTAKFNEPYGVTVDNNGNVFVADTVNRRIRKISGNQVTTVAGNDSGFDKDGKGTEASFGNTHSVMADSSGNIYFSSTVNKIKKLTPDGLVTSIAGWGTIRPVVDGPGKTATFNNIKGIVFDSNGNMFIAETGNSLIRKLTFK